MRIVGVQDLGSLGPTEGKPTTYYWPIYLHIVRLLPVAMLLLLMVRRPNRKRSAWLVLLPVLVVPLLTSLALQQSDMGDVFGFLNDLVTVFLFSMAFLWLYADKLEGLSRPGAFLSSIMILAIAGVIGIIGASSLSFTVFIIPTMFLYGILAVVTVITLSLAGIACRKQYTPLRYFAWSFIISVLGIGGLLSLPIGFFMLMLNIVTGESAGISDLLSNLAQAIVPGLIGGAVFFLFLLPFLALALWAPAFRARFYAIFRLPGMYSIVEPPVYIPAIPIPSGNDDLPDAPVQDEVGDTADTDAIGEEE